MRCQLPVITPWDERSDTHNDDLRQTNKPGDWATGRWVSLRSTHHKMVWLPTRRMVRAA
jgi:hypothetical protein